MNEYRLRPVRDARDRDERTAKTVLAGRVGDAQATAAAVEAASRRVAVVRAQLAEGRRVRDLQTHQHGLALAERYVQR
ncbi:MAG: hypothetical protein H0T79_07390, partial [Deltaproteobacteria bacterium]|nr:hypothetical protein [Deltaproteobacteria bacterium]